MQSAAGLQIAWNASFVDCYIYFGSILCDFSHISLQRVNAPSVIS